MAREKFTNNVIAHLNGAINNSTTSILVDVGSAFPANSFRIMIDSEIMICSSRSSNTLTVVRGSEGTSAASHVDGSTVTAILPAGAIDKMRLQFMEACGACPDDVSLSADDDNFDDETFSGWTKVWNGGPTPDVTIVEKNHTASFLHSGGSTSGHFISYMKAKTPSAGDWIQSAFSQVSPSDGFPQNTLWMANGATWNSGNQVGFAFSPNENQMVLRGHNGYNSQSSFDGFGVHTYKPLNWIHQRMVWESSNHYSTYMSVDGIQWATCKSNTSSGSVGTVTHMGIGFTTWAGLYPTIWSLKYVRFSF